MEIEARVIELVEEKIADREDLFLVGVKLHSNGKLEVLVDGDQGVSIQDCANISRHLGFHLEEEGIITHAYRLEVSSPGIDTPLTSLRQYQKNVGRNVQLKLHDGTVKEGELLEVAADHVMIAEKIKEKGKKAVIQQNSVPFDDITTTKVLISFK